MTTSQEARTSPVGSTDRGAVVPLADELTRLVRVLHALKGQQHGGTSEQDRERAAHVLLFPLVQLGPLRQQTLAELLHADPSTVSRHVTRLVQHGLVHRVADAHDGRASSLVVTPEGEAVLEGMRQDRTALLTAVTSSWSEPDLASLTRLLRRFVSDLDDHLPARTGGTTPSASPEKDR